MKTAMKEALKWPVERSFNLLEQALVSRYDRQPPYPPIFVLGPPRSGTTLLMQVLAQRFHTCYFTNFIDRFHASPVVAGAVARAFGGCKVISGYNSHYGRTSHWNDPSDGTKTWLRWFPYAPVYSPLNSIPNQAVQEIRATVALYERIYNAPFINKAQRNNGRLLELDRIFPDALFIRIHRSPVRIIQSILHAMNNDLRGHDIWFSLRPSNHAEITTTDLLEHVCEEIFFTEKDITRDSRTIGEHRIFNLEYDNLCAEPANVLAAIKRFYETQSGLDLKTSTQVPDQFSVSQRRYGSAEEVTRIEQYLAVLEDRNHSP